MRPKKKDAKTNLFILLLLNFPSPLATYETSITLTKGFKLLKTTNKTK